LTSGERTQETKSPCVHPKKAAVLSEQEKKDEDAKEPVKDLKKDDKDKPRDVPKDPAKDLKKKGDKDDDDDDNDNGGSGKSGMVPFPDGPQTTTVFQSRAVVVLDEKDATGRATGTKNVVPAVTVNGGSGKSPTLAGCETFSPSHDGPSLGVYTPDSVTNSVVSVHGCNGGSEDGGSGAHMANLESPDSIESQGNVDNVGGHHHQQGQGHLVAGERRNEAQQVSTNAQLQGQGSHGHSATHLQQQQHLAQRQQYAQVSRFKSYTFCFTRFLVRPSTGAQQSHERA
jgi:hypothetical protein